MLESTGNASRENFDEIHELRGVKMNFPEPTGPEWGVTGNSNQVFNEETDGKAEVDDQDEKDTSKFGEDHPTVSGLERSRLHHQEEHANDAHAEQRNLNATRTQIVTGMVSTMVRHSPVTL